MVKASGNTVEPYYPSIFAKALQGENITSVIENLGAAPVAAAKTEEHAEAKGRECSESCVAEKKGGKKEKKEEKEEKKEEKKEEEVGGIADIFGD